MSEPEHVVGRINLSPLQNIGRFFTASPFKRKQALLDEWDEHADRLEELSKRLEAQGDHEGANTTQLIADCFRVCALQVEERL